MKDIIAPVPTEKIVEELSHDLFLRKTNYGDNEIYIFNAKNAPNTMRETGRLREISFRDSGGGTGLDCDIDIFDTCEEGHFEQLIVWNPEDKQIVGGYRFLFCDKLPRNAEGQVETATSELFDYSPRFLDEYLPYTIELGRSFVQPEYQPSKNFKKGIYSLDNLWDGLATLIDIYPKARYYFGKVTMYPQFNVEARDMILHFLKTNFPDNDNLVAPKPELRIKQQTPQERLDPLFKSSNYKENYRTLIKEVRALGQSVPPLVNAYMNLSPTMRVFGTAINAPFGNVEETGIMITISEIAEDNLERHKSSEPINIPSYLR